MYGWVRAARETKGAIGFSEYLSLSTSDRSLLHEQIDVFLEDLEEVFKKEKERI